MSEKKKLRTKDLQDLFEEVKSSDELDISLTISKSSSSVASQVIEPIKDENKDEKISDAKEEETVPVIKEDEEDRKDTINEST